MTGAGMRVLLVFLSLFMVVASPRFVQGRERVMVESYRNAATGSDTVTLTPESAPMIAQKVRLTLEEEYHGASVKRSFPAGTTISHRKSHDRLPGVISSDPRISLALFLLLLGLFLFGLHRYLAFRIARALRNIPWKNVRADGSVQGWPDASLFRKIHYWNYLKDLRSLERIHRHHDQRTKTTIRTMTERVLFSKYLARLKTVRRSDESLFILGVFSVIGRVEVAHPILALLQRFPEDDKVAKGVALALLAIRDAKLLRILLPTLPEANPLLWKICVDVSRSFGTAGVDQLCKELHRLKDPAIRIGLLNLLGEIGRERAVPEMESYLVKGDEETRIATASALMRTGAPEAVESLIDGICHNPSARVRREIARILRKAPPATVVYRFNRMIASSPTFYLRIRAIEALEILQPEECQVFYAALEDRHPKVRAAAAAVLERTGWVKEELQGYGESYSEESRTLLIQAGRAGSLAPFLALLDHENPKVVKRIVRLLARIGKGEAVAPLMALLAACDDWTLQSRLIPALAALQATEAVPLILEHLKSSHHWVRKVSMDALGTLLTPDSELREATLPILRAALEDDHPWTRASAVSVLTTLEDSSSVARLIELLRDEQTRVRMEAIRALKHFHALQAEGALIDLLNDPRAKVCAMAASALGQFKSRRALMKLFDRFDEATSILRLAIIEAVAEIDPLELDPLLPKLMAATSTNLKVVRSMKHLVSADARRLIHSLARQGETAVRSAALRNLPEEEDREVQEFLQSSLRDREASVRAAAVDAIALRQNPEMSEMLSEMRNDPEGEVRHRVMLALGLIKNPDTLPYLRNCLYEEDPATRAHALMALFHYAEPRFLEYFLEQFREIRVRNILKKMLAEGRDPVVNLLVEKVPSSRQEELAILKNHTLKSLDCYLEEQILGAEEKEGKFKAFMIAEILKRKKLKKVLKKVIEEDPLPEVRARALRAFANIAPLSREKDLVQKALQDPALEVQTIASRLLIHLEKVEV